MDTQATPPQMPVAAQPQATAFTFPKSREILKSSWELYKARFWTLLGISLMPFAILFASGFVVGLINAQTKEDGPIALVVLVLIAILGIYVSIWSFAATIRNILSEQPLSFGDSFKLASHDIWPIFITGILVGLAVLGGTILLIIPGIIFAFWFGLSQYVAIEEKLSGVEAMKKSKFYVTGNIWELFKKGFYFGLITIGIAILFALVLGILGAAVNSEMVAQIGQNVFNIFWSPLATVYSFMMYRYAKASKQTPVA